MSEPEKSECGFQTARGSTYVVHDDGTTTRFKAKRSDLGHEGDFGLMKRSVRTYYLTQDAALRLTLPSGSWRIVDHGDGTLSLATLEAKWGIPPSARCVPVALEPAMGLRPYELWQPETLFGLPAYSQNHLGNPIVSMR